MKTAVIVSDTHGNVSALRELSGLFAENDYIIHLGDGANDMRGIRGDYPEKVYQCAGNCDFLSPFSEEEIIEIEKVRIFYCHGHKYRVKQGLAELARKAKTCGCDIALYGHTHEACISKAEGVTLINPGTMYRKLHEGGSYCYLVIDGKTATPVLVGESLQ